MIFASSMPDGSGQSAENQPQASTSAVPFYRRSLFWLAAGLLTGVALLFLLHGCEKEEEQTGSAARPLSEQSEADQEKADAPLRDLLVLQQAQNKGLEEEILRLQGLLSEDPCAIPAAMGNRPEQSPVAPGYVQAPPPSEEAPAPKGGATQSHPVSNSTAALEDAAPQPQQERQVLRENAAASPSAPESVADLLARATVFVLSQHKGQTGAGSGFFVAPGVIATNSHVVQGPEAKVLVGNKALGGMREARVVAFSNEGKRDYALLKISDDLAGKAPVLLIARGAKRTERVSAWGFPGYIAEIDPKLKALARGDSRSVPEVVYSEGVVSVVLERTPPVILHTASISQGNSGGPLVNAQGVVVGVNTFIKQANKSYSQTNIALTGEDLAKFMAEMGIQATMAEQ